MKKSIISAVSAGLGIIGGGLLINGKKEKKLKEAYEVINKNDVIIQLFNQWMALRQSGITLDEYFVNNDYKSIAIYGMSCVGERLYEELRESPIVVKYAIDKRAEDIFADIEVLRPDAVLDEVDAVVVTAIYYYDDIERELSEVFDCPIISLEDVIEDLQV